MGQAVSRHDAAFLALLAARLAGIGVVAQDGDILLLAETPPEIVEELRRHKPAERCEACHGAGTVDHPLLEASFAGHPLLIHEVCIASFVESEAAASERFAPQAVCDFCGVGPSGGKMETVGYAGVPVAGVPVHLGCLAAWFERLDQGWP
jgi:hypothetical protein